MCGPEDSMSVFRSVFTGVVGLLAFMALVYFWSSWSVDEVSTFRTAFHGGVTPVPKFVCNTHFAAGATMDTLDWRCEALNTICRQGVQSACERVADFKPDAAIMAPRSPASSLLPNPAFEKELSDIAPVKKDSAPLGIKPKVYGGSVNDIPHISPEQLERDRSDGTPTTANPNSAPGPTP
jgi:hypothetical protein